MHISAYSTAYLPIFVIKFLILNFNLKKSLHLNPYAEDFRYSGIERNERHYMKKKNNKNDNQKKIMIFLIRTVHLIVSR